MFIINLTYSQSIINMDMHDGKLFKVSWKDNDFVKDDSIIRGPSSTNSSSTLTEPYSLSSKDHHQDEDVFPEALPSENEDKNNPEICNDSSQENGSEPAEVLDMKGSTIVLVQRVQLISDMVELFSQETIMKKKLKFVVINGYGKTEIGQDGLG